MLQRRARRAAFSKNANAFGSKFWCCDAIFLESSRD
jgi:hypothetical protein